MNILLFFNKALDFYYWWGRRLFYSKEFIFFYADPILRLTLFLGAFSLHLSNCVKEAVLKQLFSLCPNGNADNIFKSTTKTFCQF